ncbi:hypothetical protein B0T22DRAFT_230097 [Podospora appendiculata]|uniref:Uncharacterized protein n=1 Tax=Podospora appendiculata TaxID=314037 RepID=A0AAE0X5U9_9PEZI|nr:hypothetical protein B0T22DRAFT_230097 [Podospora appendiculata]
MTDQAAKSGEDAARLAAIQRAMMDDIGMQRLEELPMEDGEHDHGSHRRNHNVSSHHPHVVHSTPRVNNPGVGTIWNTAIASGVFDDDDAEAVKGLDDFGGGRLYAAKAAATRVLKEIQPISDFLNRYGPGPGPRHRTEYHGRRNTPYTHVGDGPVPLPFPTSGTQRPSGRPGSTQHNNYQYARQTMRSAVASATASAAPTVRLPPTGPAHRHPPAPPAPSGPHGRVPAPSITQSRQSHPARLPPQARATVKLPAMQSRGPSSPMTNPQAVQPRTTQRPGLSAGIPSTVTSKSTSHLTPSASTSPTPGIFSKVLLQIAVRFINPFSGKGPEDSRVVICQADPTGVGEFRLFIGDSIYFGWSLRLWHNYAIDEENLELMIQFKNDQGEILTYNIRFLSYKDIMQVIGTVRALRTGERVTAPTGTAPAAGRPSTPQIAPTSRKASVPGRATITNEVSVPRNESTARAKTAAQTARIADGVTTSDPKTIPSGLRTVGNAHNTAANASGTESTLTIGQRPAEHTFKPPETLPRESDLSQQSTVGPGETRASHGVPSNSVEPPIPSRPSAPQLEGLGFLIDLEAEDPEITIGQVLLPSTSEELSKLDPFEYPSIETVPHSETDNTESHGHSGDPVEPPSETREPQTMQSFRDTVLSLARNLLKVWSLAGKSGENMMQAAQTAEGIKQALLEHVLSLNQSESPEVKEAIEQMFEDILPSKPSASVKLSQETTSAQQGRPSTSAETSQVSMSAETIQQSAAKEQEYSAGFDVDDHASGPRGCIKYSREDLLSLKQFAKPPTPGRIKNTPVCREPSPHRPGYVLSAENSRAQISKSVNGFSWVSGGAETSTPVPESKARNASVGDHSPADHDRKMDVGDKNLHVPDRHLGTSAPEKSRKTRDSGLKQSLWATPDVEIKNANFFTGPAYKKAWPKNSYCYELSQLNPHDRVDAPADEVANFYFSGPSTHSEQRDFAMGAMPSHLEVPNAAKTDSLGRHSGTHARSTSVTNTDASVGSNLDLSVAGSASSPIVSHAGSSTARVEDLSRQFSGLSLASWTDGQSQPREETAFQSLVPSKSVMATDRAHRPAAVKVAHGQGAVKASKDVAQENRPRDPTTSADENNQPVLRGLAASRHSAPETIPASSGKFNFIHPSK